MNLSVQLGKRLLKNPVSVASGTAGNGPELAEYIDLNRLGAFFTKAVTLKPRQGNPQPRIRELPTGMLNSIGLANPGLDHFVRDVIPFWTQYETPLYVNVAGSTESDYVTVCGELDRINRIDGLELNVSCPNVKEGGIGFGSDPQIMARLIEQCRRVTSHLLIVKLTPQVTSIAEMARVAEAAGADALSLINTVPGMGIDIHTRRPFLNTTIGGYSGPGIKPIALAQVWQAFNSVQIPVIGLGGIRSAADVIEFVLAGAHLIQVGTMNFTRPDFVTDLIQDLEELTSDMNEPGLDPLRGTVIT